MQLAYVIGFFTNCVVLYALWKVGTRLNLQEQTKIHVESIQVSDTDQLRTSFDVQNLSFDEENESLRRSNIFTSVLIQSCLEFQVIQQFLRDEVANSV